MKVVGAQIRDRGLVVSVTEGNDADPGFHTAR